MRKQILYKDILKSPAFFLLMYFLAIFFWLMFCYRQVQKAYESRNDAESSAMKIETEEEKETENAETDEGKKDGGNRTGDIFLPAEEKPETEDADGEKIETEESIEDAWDGNVRVVLTGANGIYHEKICLKAGEEELEITAESEWFQNTDRLCISVVEKEGEEAGKISVTSLEKADGNPAYAGNMEIFREKDGLVLVNELSLEDYVKGVLPGEMPSSYPLEALKAQAVCARTYVMMKQENMVYPQYQAAVDDSTACQVYQNQKNTERTDLAVEETAGEVLVKAEGGEGGDIYAPCYYYSTSCGRYATEAVWHGGEEKELTVEKSAEQIEIMNDDFFAYISGRTKSHLEVEEAFYRWKYRVEEAEYERIYERCRQRQKINERLVTVEREKEDGEEENGISQKTLGEIKNMEIAERQEGGVADCLRIICEKGTVCVWGEYNIRYVLAQGGSIVRQDDSAFPADSLLPSAFLSLQSICNGEGNVVGYIIVGGGFGHGVGMSQNGAKHMAQEGNQYREILENYYSGCKLKELSSYE